jgi:alanyl aminopeptidase
LRIDPREERFAGTTSIDLTVSDAASGIWLHGKDLEVSEVYVVDRELNRINASHEQHLDSGVALVSLESPVASGEATLNLVYTAAFNTSTNALFKVLRGEDAYAATQFEPIAARQVFPGFDDPGFKVPFDLSLVTQADDRRLCAAYLRDDATDADLPARVCSRALRRRGLRHDPAQFDTRSRRTAARHRR